MAISLHDLANILDKIILSEYWKWLFRASRFQNFLGEKTPDPPSSWPNQHSGDSSVIKKYPQFLILKKLDSLRSLIYDQYIRNWDWA